METNEPTKLPIIEPVLSACCGARIIYGQYCSDCKEWAEAVEIEEDLEKEND